MCVLFLVQNTKTTKRTKNKYYASLYSLTKYTNLTSYGELDIVPDDLTLTHNDQKVTKNHGKENAIQTHGYIFIRYFVFWTTFCGLKLNWFSFLFLFRACSFFFFFLFLYLLSLLVSFDVVLCLRIIYVCVCHASNPVVPIFLLLTIWLFFCYFVFFFFLRQQKVIHRGYIPYIRMHPYRSISGFIWRLDTVDFVSFEYLIWPTPIYFRTKRLILS